MISFSFYFLGASFFSSSLLAVHLAILLHSIAQLLLLFLPPYHLPGLFWGGWFIVYNLIFVVPPGVAVGASGLGWFF
jgi:hypothetical protein